MTRPRLLDLFCGAGGAAMGYWLAGFDIVGVDIAYQKHYPFDFVQADALEYCSEHGKEFDVIHASPPCQEYSYTKSIATKYYPELIEQTRDALKESGKQYIIENVPGAPLVDATLLCGTMFDLPLYRHRLFETSFIIPFMLHHPHYKKQDRLTGKDRKREIVLVVGKGTYKGWRKRASCAMGINWMLEEELAEAIPPAYTEFIGRKLIAALGAG